MYKSAMVVALAALLLSATPSMASTMLTSHYGVGDGYHGKRGANGKIFSAYKFTAAHKTLPFGTMLKVTYPTTGNSACVEVTDRGPFHGGRDLDVAYIVAKELGFEGKGVANLEVERGGCKRRGML
jgi:rare lipoprotein A